MFFADITWKTRGRFKLFKGPCWDLRELISELQDCGGRPRPNSLCRLAVAWHSRTSCHIAKLLLSPRGSALIGSPTAYAPRRATTHIYPLTWLFTHCLYSIEWESEKHNTLSGLCFSVSACCNAVWTVFRLTGRLAQWPDGHKHERD